MTFLANIADRALNRPLLLHPAKAEILAAVLGGRIGIQGPDASRFEGSPLVEPRGKPRPYNVSNGVGIITITGSLVNRGAWIGASSGMTSYEGIQHQIKTAAADDAVKSVILDLHTPGGEAIGAFETADVVRKLAARKRVVAFVNGMAASAGYAIAAGASEIVTTETGVSGSIGVVLLHVDFSAKLAEDGVKPTLIFAGAHKVDGNPFEPLSKDVRADLQAEVNALYDLFIRTVAKGRGLRLTAGMAKDTEARALIGKAAVAAGLADRVGTLDEVLADLSGKALPAGSSAGMVAHAEASEVIIPRAEHDAAVKQAYDEGFAEGYAEEVEKGRQSVLNRMLAIIDAPEIKGNEKRFLAAVDLAMENPELSAASVIKIASLIGSETKLSAALANRENTPDSLALAAFALNYADPRGKA